MRFISTALIVISLALIISIFLPVAREEIKYDLSQIANQEIVPLVPPNKTFSILIPKIRATAAIIPEVDSQNKNVYLSALRKGVAHAKGTGLPGQGGNIFLFAHSTDTFYNVGSYNAVFYLIGKLDDGDEISVYYQGEEIKYSVTGKKVVPATEVSYLKGISDSETLTLMTCYPPGTTLKRLIVTAKRFEIAN